MAATAPANSHGASDARVSTLPSAADTKLPPAVTSATMVTAPAKSSGGVTSTMSRSAGLVRRAASAHPATKQAPPTGAQLIQAASSKPAKKSADMPTSAPRAVQWAPERSATARADPVAHPSSAVPRDWSAVLASSGLPAPAGLGVRPRVPVPSDGPSGPVDPGLAGVPAVPGAPPARSAPAPWPAGAPAPSAGAARSAGAVSVIRRRGHGGWGPGPWVRAGCPLGVLLGERSADRRVSCHAGSVTLRSPRVSTALPRAGQKSQACPLSPAGPGIAVRRDGRVCPQAVR